MCTIDINVLTRPIVPTRFVEVSACGDGCGFFVGQLGLFGM